MVFLYRRIMSQSHKIDKTKECATIMAVESQAGGMVTLLADQVVII